MKKAVKIFLYFFGVLILFSILVFIFHDSILSYVLKKVISGKSRGKVELNLESCQLNLKDGFIFISKPALILSDVYMNEANSIKVDKIVLKKIEIDKLEIWALITDRNIIADRFLIEKPEFWFTELGTASKSSFHPEKLIKAVNQNPDMFSRIKIRIDDIEIQYGSIMLSEYTSPDVDPGLVDFTIMLEGFNSHPDSGDNQNRILFSDEFRFRLRNLHKNLKSGYTLDIDSAVFSSNHRDLFIGGASLQPTNRNIDQSSVAIKAGRLVLHDIGLEEVRGLEDLSLGSIVLADGEFVNFTNNSSKSQKKTEKSQGLDELAKVLYDFRLDTISISDFNYYDVRDFTDTVISADEIDFLMTGIKIDSGMFHDLFWNIRYDDIALNTGSFALKKLIPNLTVSYDLLSYSDFNSNFRLFGVNLTVDTIPGSLQQTNLSIPKLQINGVSLSDLQKRRKQRLSITISNPEGNIDLAQQPSQNKPDNKKIVFPGYLILDKIVLSNGNINVYKANDFFIGLTGFDLELDGLKLPESETDQIKYDQISFGYDQVDTYFEKESISIVTGGMGYNSKQLWINDIDLKLKSHGSDGRIRLRKVNLTDFELDRLVFENELHLASIELNEPVINGDILISAEDNSIRKEPDKRKKTAPISVKVDQIDIINGNVDAVISHNAEQFKVSTGYNILLKNIQLSKGDQFQSLTDHLLWRAVFSNLKLDAADHSIGIESVLSDAFRSKFRIEGLNISTNIDSPDRLKVKRLSLPLIDVKGLDYGLLLKHDSIALNSLLIDNLDADVVFPAIKQPPEERTTEKINLRKYLVFSYDTIVMSKLHFNVEKPGDSSHAVFSLKGFNFSHHISDQPDTNLIANIGFAFNEFSFSDSVSGKYLSIEKGFLDSGRRAFTIKGVEGGNPGSKEGSSTEAPDSGTDFKSSLITFSGVYLKESLPSRLDIDRLFVADIDLSMTKIKSTGAPKAGFSLDLEVLKKFTNVMTKLSVDTADFGDISFHYKTLDDTASHTIQFDSIGIIVNKIDIDTSMINMSNPNLIGNIIVDLKGKTRITKDSLYEIRTGRLHYDFPKHMITIDSFRVVPRFDSIAFFEKAVYQTGRINLFSRKININNFNVEKLFIHDHIHIGSVDFHDLRVEIFKDKRFPMKPGIYKELPREQLMGIQQKFTIDSVHFINSYLKYIHHEEKSEQPGSIFFNPFDVTAYNISNQIIPGDRETTLKLLLYAKLMGESKMNLSLYFPLYPDSTSFWLTAKTETIRLSSLNSITENVLGIGITKGKGNVDIPLIRGNDSIATGALTFRYKKLRLAMYNRKKEQLNKGILSPLINFMINDLVVKSNNPKFARKPRIGQVYNIRDTRKAVVNFAWKGILSGLLSTLGFNNKEQRKERKQMEKN